MSKALTIPAQGEPRLEAVRAAVMRVDGLLALWTTDFRQMPTDALTRLRDAAEAALKEGDAGQLADVMEMPATEHDIAHAVFELIGAFPQYKDEDITIFARSMTLDVRDAKPGYAALMAACRHLRRTATRRPLIAEMLAALEVKGEAFQQRALLLGKLERRIALASEVLKGRGDG